MPLSSGTRIGPFEVVSPLGAGGMGEVYRARDAKLGRDVALKILPDAVAADSERVLRFEREARTLAALNHPNIAHVYGFEQDASISALVMELVDGDDLAARLGRGAIPAAEALAIARQIADALEFAHAHGVIHRDLKPANVKIRQDGAVKILDFGLAKALEPFAANASDRVDAATMTSPAMTLQGVILGTAAYMSPEQARGQSVDQRADIWAFGVVLYEMLTGRLAFAAPTVTDTLARVIEREPDWNALPPNTPAPVRTLLRRCLEKDPRRRAPHIGMARLELDDALASDAAVSGALTPPPAVGRSKRSMAPVAALVAVVAVASAGIAYVLKPAAVPAPAAPYRALILIDENMDPRAPSDRFALSPDGRWLAYVGADDQSREIRLWIRPLNDFASQPVTGTDGASHPFWSPDGRSVGYLANGQLWRVELGGGLPTKICDAPNRQQNSLGAAWGPDDTIVFSSVATLWRVPARGGVEPKQLTTLEASSETQHGRPWFLPDGRQLLFSAYKGIEPVGVFAVDLQSGARMRVMENAANAQFARGRIVFTRGTALVAQQFDPARLTLSGDPVTLADPILGNIVVPRAGGFSVSESGALVYIPLTQGDGSRLVWVTRDGQQQIVDENATSSRNIALAPDGLRAATIPMGFDGIMDLWVIDLKRRVRSRITQDVQPTMSVWSRDGRTLFYSARRGSGPLNIYSRGEFGTGPEKAVFESDVDKWITSVAADGRTILYETQRPGLQWDVFALTIEPAPGASAILEGPFSERAAQFSPDGQWIAYTQTDPRRGNEVFIARFPTGAHRTQISAAGGGFPRWHPNRRELIFHTGTQFMAVPITLRADGADVGAPTPLFNSPAPEGFARAFYDIAADGRFLVSLPGAQAPGARLALLTNWPALSR